MVIELLEDMESLITPGKQWRKGQLLDLDNESAENLIKGGKAKIADDASQPSKEPPKKSKIPKQVS